MTEYNEQQCCRVECGGQQRCQSVVSSSGAGHSLVTGSGFTFRGAGHGVKHRCRAEPGEGQQSSLNSASAGQNKVSSSGAG